MGTQAPTVQNLLSKENVMVNSSKSRSNLGTPKAIVIDGDVYDSPDQFRSDGKIHDGR